MNSTPALPLDKDGYLKNLGDWSEEVAEQLAAREGITLSAEHWEVIYLLREFYQTYELSPAMRPLVMYAREKLGRDKGQSLYLLKLFPPNAALMGSKIAGLPRPANCF